MRFWAEAAIRNGFARRRIRRGQALVEFAIVALVAYLLIGGALTLGYAIYAAQAIQQVANFAAKQIAQTPLPADIELEDLLYADESQHPAISGFRSEVFDQEYLVVDLDGLPQDGNRFLSDVVAGWPQINQQLYPLMILDVINGRRSLRYPGTLRPADTSTGFTVRIPVIDNGTLRFVPVLEEIDSEGETDDGMDDGNEDPFLPSSRHRGLVAIRVNYPMHSPFLSAFDDAGPVPGDTPGPSQGPLGTGYGPYAGADGLGRQAGPDSQPVRPFRRVISAQAIYRREIFAP